MSDANFSIVLHSNYGSILFSFRDMIRRQTTDGRKRTDVAAAPSLKGGSCNGDYKVTLLVFGRALRRLSFNDTGKQ